MKINVLVCIQQPLQTCRYDQISIIILVSFLLCPPEPKDPPKNVIVSIIPEEVNRVKVTFTPPEEPNGNITSYFVYIYEKDQLVKNMSLNIIQREHNTLTAVIEGLKGGNSYSIQARHILYTQAFTFRHSLSGHTPGAVTGEQSALPAL